jgi:myosin heavy subunit
MRRSESWPQLFDLSIEKEGNVEHDPETQEAYDSLAEKENECSELQIEVANYETHCNELTLKVEQMEMENQFLTKENASLKEENSARLERLKLLEHQCSQESLHVKELECIITELKENYDEVENDKRIVCEQLSTQRTSFVELQYSNKNLEGQVQQLQESTEWRQMEQSRVQELVKENKLLKAQLQDMEQHLTAMEKEAQDTQLISKENNEMQLQISKMVQQNVHLRRQMSDVTQTKELLEKLNQVLQDEMETMRMESSNSNEPHPPQVHCIQQYVHEVEDELEENQAHIGEDTYFDDGCVDRGCKMQILPTETHLARTPPAISLADEIEFSMYSAHALCEDKVAQPVSNSSDALQEYVHLTAAAVKIRFHMVPISSEKLIKLASEHPFYRMHEELTKYMEGKLQKQEASPQKPLQDDHQKQESDSRNKVGDQHCNASALNTQPSVFNKVRNLFRPWSATELPRKEPEGI